MQTCFRWLLFPHLLLPVLSLKVSLSGPSTTTAPASARANWEREDGDSSITSIGVLDITASGGPKVIRDFQVPEASRSGSFQVDLTSPGTYYLQGLNTDGSPFGPNSNTITVLQSTSPDTRTTSVSTKRLTTNLSTDLTNVEASVLSTATFSSTSTSAITTSSSLQSASTGLQSEVKSTEDSPVSSESRSETDQSTSTADGGPSVTSYQSVIEPNLPISIPWQESNTPLGPSQTAIVPTKGADRNTVILGAVLGSVISFIIGTAFFVFCFRRCGHRLCMPRLYGQKRHPTIPTPFYCRPSSRAWHPLSVPLRDPGSLEEVKKSPDVERASSPAATTDISLLPPRPHSAVAPIPSESDSATYVDSLVSRRASLNTDITVLKIHVANRLSKNVPSTSAASRELVGVNVDRELPEVPPLESPPWHPLEDVRSRGQENNGNEAAIRSVILDLPPPYQSSSDKA